MYREQYGDLALSSLLVLRSHRLRVIFTPEPARPLAQPRSQGSLLRGCLWPNSVGITVGSFVCSSLKRRSSCSFCEVLLPLSNSTILSGPTGRYTMKLKIFCLSLWRPLKHQGCVHWLGHYPQSLFHQLWRRGSDFLFRVSGCLARQRQSTLLHHPQSSFVWRIWL